MASIFKTTVAMLGPVVPRGSVTESLRAGAGAVLGLGAVALVQLAAPGAAGPALYLIAPFGASAVLLFAAPSSPLAQPWPTVVGSSVAALVAVLVCRIVPDPVLRVPLAAGLAITAMIALRALHPPGGAVAMTVALMPAAVEQPGWWFALCPVALGTSMLVAIAMIYARLTGRHYPLRHFDEKNAHGTDDPDPSRRLGLGEDELAAILARYRQSLNLGVEDLARLIAAAETQAAGRRAGPLEARDIMSRDLVMVGPMTTLAEVADIFRLRGFTSLPVVSPEGLFLGVIFQIHLIRRAREDAFERRLRFSTALSHLLDRGFDRPVLAREIMATEVPVTAPDAPVAALLARMAEEDCDAVPVLDAGMIVGIVTRSDLIAALAFRAPGMLSSQPM